jgi:hypothetical protein
VWDEDYGKGRAMDTGRARLIRLKATEIDALLSELPHLSVWWARPAQVSEDALHQRQANAVRAVRVKLGRNTDAFHHGLAWTAIRTFTDLEPDSTAVVTDAETAAEEFASGVGVKLGPDVGAFVISVVAESNLPFSEIVQDHLDACLSIAAQAIIGEVQSDPEAQIDTGDEPKGDTPSLPLALAVHEEVIGDFGPLSDSDEFSEPHVDASALDEPFKLGNLRTTLGQVADLLDEASSIADELRNVAAKIELGEVPTDQTALAQSTTWLARARRVLTNEETLQDAAARIRRDIRVRSAKLDELTELARAIESLQSAGLEKHATDLLSLNGFESIDVLLRAIAALDSRDNDIDPSKSVGDISAAVAAVSGPNSEMSGVVDLLSETQPQAARTLAGADTQEPGREDQGEESGNDQLPEPNSTDLFQIAANEDSSIAPARHPEINGIGERPLVVRGVESDEPSSVAVEATFPDEVNRVETTTAVSKRVDLQHSPTVELSSPQAKPVEVGPPVGLSEHRGDTDEDAAIEADNLQIGINGPDYDEKDRDSREAPIDPWTDGTLSSLILDGREKLAVIAAEALGATPGRVRILRLFAGAFGTRAETLLAQEPELTIDDSPDGDRNADESRVLFAAFARLALELGFSPVGSLERFRQAGAFEGHAASETATELVRLASRGFKRPLGMVELTGLPDDWRNFADAAESKMAALQDISISYQRASRIVHFLARANQTVGAALAGSADLAKRYASGQRPSRDEWSEIESVLITLRDPQRRERLLNETDRKLSTSQQLRSPIVSSARDRLFSALNDVAHLLEEGLVLRARAEGSESADDPQGMANLVAIAHQASFWPDHTVGDAALKRLIEWVQSEDVTTQSPAALSQLLADELLPLFEIPRDASGVPSPTTLGVADLKTLIHSREPLEIVRGYLQVGNVRNAEHVLLRSALARTTLIDDEFAQSAQALARRHRDLLTQIDRILDRLRSLYDDDLVRQLGQELEEHREHIPGRYDLHIGPLEDIRDRGDARLDDVRAGLRERANGIVDEGDSRRILDLLESRDEQLAVDYLSLAEAGEALPFLAPPAGDDFGVFFPGTVRVGEGTKRQRPIDNMNDVRRHLGASSAPTNRMLNQGLKAWNELVNDGRAVQMTEGRLAHVLRMLGLIPTDQRWVKELTKARHAGYATYAVKATPIDRSYVPSLGTQAHGSYDVTIVWDEASPKRLLQYVETNRRTQANIILYLKTLTVEQRIELRKLTARAGSDFSPIVVDMPVVAWLSVREEPGWRLTQRVTLPFTTLNPYTPFAGGEVPDEVFVGREAEQREIIDPTGSMFVYGGRQLGKSALLRRVERLVMSSQLGGEDSFEHGQIAVYLDLKSEGIGESAPPSALWAALAPRLAKAGVLSPGLSEWTAESVVAGILEWLESDTSRRLLILLDEADSFLTLDAKDTGNSQTGGFPVLQKLKGLMERTGRRFKPVFAGLHQVQRFHGLPNTPVVHGGQDILIGPLKSVDARELVRDPLYALGYDFETPDTMWRLLRLTNYQASLIQIICEALVRHMRMSSLPREGGRVVITARDVDDVYAKREVRDLIAQRFRWTINLDNRYRVIALVTAVRSLESNPGERFRATELHDECEYFWSAGFSRDTLSSAEFARYLDEMKGLGVLHQQGDEFGLRSPSILGLLGSKDTIVAELIEASDHLEVGYQYNPTMNRRTLSQDAAGAETRSPLPDSELAGLLSHSAAESRVKIVMGTSALGIERVIVALRRAAAERNIRLVEVEPPTLRDQLGDGDETHLIVDLTGADAPTIRAVLEALSGQVKTFVTVVMLADANAHPPGHDNWDVVNLQRWSVEGLQSWHESPFRRNDLKSATGGWPNLVEEAISLVMRGASNDSALSSVAARLSDPLGASQFLASTGVPIDIASTWLDWFGTDNESGSIELTPASIDDLTTAFGVNARPIVDQLHSLQVIDEVADGWILDQVVALATRHLQE